MAEQALSCIEALLESVPAWIADIEHILKTSTETQNERLAAEQPADDSPPRSVRRRLSKSSSLQSPRQEPEVKLQDVAQPSAVPEDLLRPQLRHMTASDALRLSQRKRKTFSTCSGDPSTPDPTWSTAMVVVYYDGDAQKRFTELVRVIGASRNGVRKAKMSAASDLTSAPQDLSSTSSSSDGDEDELDVANLRYPSLRVLRSPSASSPESWEQDILGQVDRHLEKGQSLCEKAAHRLLRNGDCTAELNDATAELREARTVAEAQLPDLRKRAERAANRRRRSDEKHRAREEAQEKRRLQAAEEPPPPPPAAVSPVPSLIPSLPSDARLDVDLEADASDAEADFTPSALDLGRYHMRSTRLMAH